MMALIWDQPPGVPDPDHPDYGKTEAELYGVDPNAVNTIADYDEWVKEVKEHLNYTYCWYDAPMTEPWELWRELFDAKTHPNNAAFQIAFFGC